MKTYRVYVTFKDGETAMQKVDASSEEDAVSKVKEDTADFLKDFILFTRAELD